MTYDTQRQIAIIWDIEDVKSLDSNLNDNEAMEVLKLVKDRHDASLGINWDVLSCAIDIYTMQRNTI
jgi:hypothetical protein